MNINKTENVPFESYSGAGASRALCNSEGVDHSGWVNQGHLGLVGGPTQGPRAIHPAPAVCSTVSDSGVWCWKRAATECIAEGDSSQERRRGTFPEMRPRSGRLAW